MIFEHISRSQKKPSELHFSDCSQVAEVYCHFGVCVCVRRAAEQNWLHRQTSDGFIVNRKVACNRIFIFINC